MISSRKSLSMGTPDDHNVVSPQMVGGNGADAVFCRPPSIGSNGRNKHGLLLAQDDGTALAVNPSKEEIRGAGQQFLAKILVIVALAATILLAWSFWKMPKRRRLGWTRTSRFVDYYGNELGRTDKNRQLQTELDEAVDKKLSELKKLSAKPNPELQMLMEAEAAEEAGEETGPFDDMMKKLSTEEQLQCKALLAALNLLEETADRHRLFDLLPGSTSRYTGVDIPIYQRNLNNLSIDREEFIFWVKGDIKRELRKKPKDNDFGENRNEVEEIFQKVDIDEKILMYLANAQVNVTLKEKALEALVLEDKMSSRDLGNSQPIRRWAVKTTKNWNLLVPYKFFDD